MDLDLPPEVNDLDYRAITDVRLTLTYEARFDPDLEDRVIADWRRCPRCTSGNGRCRCAGCSPTPSSVLRYRHSSRRSDPPSSHAAKRDPTLHSLGLIVVTTPRARARTCP